MPSVVQWLVLASCCMLLVSSDETAACTADLPPCVAPNGILTFAEDFDSLDVDRWMTTFPWGGRNLAGQGGSGELQEYVDPKYKRLGLNPFSIADDCELSRESSGTGRHISPRQDAGAGDMTPSCASRLGQQERAGGILSIRASLVDPPLARQLDGKSYASGLLTTFRSFSQKYGYFEMRARMPYGRGLWPAFWMLPDDMSWPPEIDAMEMRGQHPSTLHVTVHTHGPNGKDAPVGFTLRVNDMTTGFHRYGVLWTSRFLAWYLDGRRVAYTATPADLSRPMYLLVNLAVGGKWAGAPDVTTRFPATMQIDYIHAYRLLPTPMDAGAHTAPEHAR